MGSIEKLRHGLGVAMFSLGERTCSESVSTSFTCMISAKYCLHFLEFFVKKGERSFVRDFFGPSKFGLFGLFFNRAQAKKCKLTKRQKKNKNKQ